MPIQRKRIASLSLGLVLVCGLGAVLFLLFHDRQGPDIQLNPLLARASKNVQFTVTARDDVSGVKSLVVRVAQEGEPVTVLERSYSPAAGEVSETFSLPASGLKDADTRLEIVAADGSLANFAKGNQGELVRSFLLDSKPPQVAVSSGMVHIRQGGSGFMVFTVSEDCSSAGVKVEQLYFPAYRQENGQYHCFFAFPLGMDPAAFKPVIVATDLAMNITERGFPCDPKASQFREDTINLPDSFLDAKNPEFEAIVPGQMTSLERFLAVNREVRVQNEKALADLAAKTGPKRLWTERFLRMEGAPTAGFGERRSYSYNGMVVDQQTHMGVDIAHHANSPAPCANTGVVVFAGYLGIYGNCVVVDHGLGLQTIYAHLSEIAVAEGQSVERGHILGKTGATGMAGGDHLHFGVTVAGLQVAPLEWWDNHWIQDNVLLRLQPQ